MTVYVDQLHDIIYRALFDMDRRALLIHLGLPADTYVGDDDDELLDYVGILALEAVAKVHETHSTWLRLHGEGVSPEQIKSVLRSHASGVAAVYKLRASKLGEPLLTAGGF